jgi:hypothetical protein
MKDLKARNFFEALYLPTKNNDSSPPQNLQPRYPVSSVNSEHLKTEAGVPSGKKKSLNRACGLSPQNITDTPRQAPGTPKPNFPLPAHKKSQS